MGGTNFNGLSLVRELVRQGHDVTVLNRGKSEADIPASVNRLVADRSEPDTVRAALAVAGAFLFSTTAMLVAAACDMAGDGVQATTVSLVYSALALFTGLGPLIAGFVADELVSTPALVITGTLFPCQRLLVRCLRRSGRLPDGTPTRARNGGSCESLLYR